MLRQTTAIVVYIESLMSDRDIDCIDIRLSLLLDILVMEVYFVEIFLQRLYRLEGMTFP